MTQLADLALESHGDVIVARVEGEIDRSNAGELGTALLAAVPNVALGLVLDLSATTYMDSAGVHLLFELGSALARRQQQVRAVVPEGASIRRVLGVVALEQSVPVHASIQEAVMESRAEAAPES